MTQVTQVTQGMNRRELMQRVAWLMGGAISAPAVLAVLDGCSRQAERGRAARVDEAQRAIIAEVAEIIIPATGYAGRAGCRSAGVHRVDAAGCLSSEEQQAFVSGLKDFDKAAQRAHGKPFLKLSQQQRVAFAQSVHDSAVADTRRVGRSGASCRSSKTRARCRWVNCARSRSG